MFNQITTNQFKIFKMLFKLNFSILIIFLALHQAQAYDMWAFFKNPLSVFSVFETKLEETPSLTVAEKLNSSIDYFYGCSCENFSCDCCSYLIFGVFDINNTGCLSLNYSSDNSLITKFNLGNQTLYDDSISSK